MSDSVEDLSVIERLRFAEADINLLEEEVDELKAQIIHINTFLASAFPKPQTSKWL